MTVPALPQISQHIWDLKYRLRAADGAPIDRTIDDTWRRVAAAAARPERKRMRDDWAGRFLTAMQSLRFLPAGRIIAGAGTSRDVTLFNCFVMGTLDDDLASIFEHVKEAALTMQRGGGIGQDFSTLRPSGALVRSIGAGASGPVSFMDVWDAMCRTIMSAGQRRGAMMATLACDHPDIEAFVDAKAEPGRLRNFNLSVLVTDAFMAAVAADAEWALQFGGKVYRRLPARTLWQRIMRATYEYAEPGVVFIDRINARDNLGYCETIRATNPCGEQPLPPYGACLLGSLNLARFVEQPFTASARLDETALGDLVPVAVRMLDNVIDISGYPLPAQRREALSKRRIGLGLTGLGDALAMCGARYGSEAAQDLARRWMRIIAERAYEASAEIASEKGAFPVFDADPFVASPNVAILPRKLRTAIARHGIRNGCLTSIAPTGTISLLAGNVSSGIEPIFDLRYERRVRGEGDTLATEVVEDFAFTQFCELNGRSARLPPAMVTAEELTPIDHLVMQAAVQAHVDSSISKTINCPEAISFEAFEEVYARAYALGLKGCTTFRPNAVTGAILSRIVQPGAASDGQGTAPPPDRAPNFAGQPAFAEDQAPGLHRSPGQPTVAEVTVDRLPARFPAAALEGHSQASGPPLDRAPVLSGFTYKLKWASSDHAIYVTINDTNEDGRWRPFEVFINTRNLEHYAWTVALTRMISAVFRRGGDVSFVAEELKAVFDPQGGHWMNGRYVPSLLAAIGDIIEQHMVRIGFLSPDGRHLSASDATTGDGSSRVSARSAGADGADAGGNAGGNAEPGDIRPERAASNSGDDPSAVRNTRGAHPFHATGPRGRPEGRLCPRCHVGALVRQSGCWICRDCGFARCD